MSNNPDTPIEIVMILDGLKISHLAKNPIEISYERAVELSKKLEDIFLIIRRMDIEDLHDNEGEP